MNLKQRLERMIIEKKIIQRQKNPCMGYTMEQKILLDRLKESIIEIKEHIKYEKENSKLRKEENKKRKLEYSIN